MGIFWVYFIIIFYEYFLDYGREKDKLSPNLKYLTIIVVGLLCLLLLFHFFNPSFLHFRYFYLKVSIIFAVIPLAVILSLFPKIWIKYLKIGLYFFGISLLYELVAVHTGQWSFPSQDFIGFVELFGVKFPFEEFLFWMVLAAASLLSYYEFFADDNK